MQQARPQLETEAIQGSCMSTWYSCSSVTCAFQVAGILGTSGLGVFKHPKLPKHRQNLPKILNPGIYGECGAIVAEILGILGKFEHGDVLGLPALQILGNWSLAMFSSPVHIMRVQFFFAPFFFFFAPFFFSLSSGSEGGDSKLGCSRMYTARLARPFI